MNKKHFEIEKHEDEVLDDFEKGQFTSVENLHQEKNLAKQAAKNYMKRSSRINIRVSEADLNMVRRIAVQEGLPYQTLLASIIHKFASGRLIAKDK